MASPTKVVLTTATGLGIVGLLAACSSGSDSKSATTSVATTTSAATGSSSASTTAKAGSGGALPDVPTGSVELQKSSANGVAYERWSNASGSTPQQIVDEYKTALTAQGYTIVNSGGGGGGWGKWGGANAGLTASKSGTYVAVQAGGQSGQPVYFEVCQGTNEQAVDQCENISQGPDSQSGGS